MISFARFIATPTATALALAFALAFASAIAPQPAAALAAAPQQQPGFPSFGQPPAAAPIFGDSRDQVDVGAIASQQRIAPGGALVIAVVLDHADGWHTWTNRGNVPQGMSVFSGAINTTIDVEAPADSPLQPHPGFIQWPAVHGATADLGDGPQEYAVFSGRAIAYVPVSVKPDAAPGEARLTLRIGFQTCDDKTCLAPAEVAQPVTIRIVEAAALAAEPVAAPPAEFAEFASEVWERIRSGEAPPQASAAPPATAAGSGASVEVPRPTFFGIPLPRTEGAMGTLVLILLSMLGGFVLNLTPCVLPIIPIKILTISQHAGSPGRTLALGMWMALGVVAFWLAIGLPAAFFTAAADPSRYFGIWWLTLAIGLIIGAMGVGIMGLFQIQLPASVYAINPRADTAWGSFWFGVMTGVLGLPCFGFVAGALLAGAATLPPPIIVIIFTSIGVGMAAPYLLLAARPGWIERIPRTGPASDLVKQVMGLLLLAAAAYFIGSGLITLVIDRPYVGNQLHWWIAALFAGAAGLWLAWRTFQITPRPAPRAVFAAVGALLTLAAVLFAIDRTDKARHEWERLAASRLSGDAFVAGAWNQYTPARFEKARDAGKIVVLDFTASWCITCQVLKATVLDPEPVKTAFESDDVVVFEVDLSSLKAPGWDHLRSIGKTGIPLLAVYTPGVDRPWDANAYTAREVLAALDEARSNARRVAAR